MTPDRCPSCHAALAAGAQWCTLCYADLRPAPVEAAPVAPVTETLMPVAEPASSGSVTEAAADHDDALTDPFFRAELVAAAIAAPLPGGGSGRHAFRPEELPVLTSADADVTAGRPGWPCQTCGESVPIELTECPKCGSTFMAAAKSNVRVQLPVVGEVTALSTGGRFALMTGGAVVIGAILFGLLALLAAIF